MKSPECLLGLLCLLSQAPAKEFIASKTIPKLDMLLIQISSSHALSRMYICSVFNGKDLGLKENKHVLHSLAHLQIISMFLLFVKKNKLILFDFWASLQIHNSGRKS